MAVRVIFFIATFAELVNIGDFRYDVWNHVPCTEYHKPDNCDLDKLDLVTVDDYDRCGPSYMSVDTRNHFLGASGRRITYKNNKDAYDRIEIMPKMMRRNLNHTLKTRVLGMEVDFPIGVSPVAYHTLASPGGEVDTVKGMDGHKTIMILSMYSNRALEEVAASRKDTDQPYLFMQLYLFQNRSISLDTVRRAEKAGFKAIVLTCDSPILGTVTCNSRAKVKFPPGVGTPNTNNISIADGGLLYTGFDDITWLKRHTTLPIIAKGILSSYDAKRAMDAGASAIMVSNHGGRQMDGSPATIDALPQVVDMMKKFYPNSPVLVDCGVRSGHDVFKALARGATMAFVGRPSVWGLAIKGSEGVNDVITKLRDDFNETMILAGTSSPKDINKNGRNLLIKRSDTFQTFSKMETKPLLSHDETPPSK